MIPANIRFQHYQTPQELKLENKFAGVPLTIPLHSDLNVSLQEIPKATAKIRNAFDVVYATYIATKMSVLLCPYWVTQRYFNNLMFPYTFAFSNTPGLLKDVKSFGSSHIHMTTYVQTSSYCGMTFTCVSHVNTIKIACVTDDTILKNPSEMIKLIERNIDLASSCLKQDCGPLLS